jgi:CRP-like cAMP-binding protein
MNEGDNKLWYLKNLDIFEGVSDMEIMQIAKKVRECQYNKDELIYSPEDSLECIYMVKRGEVRLYHSKNGKRTVFDVLGPGSVFGGIRLSSEKSTHFAETTHPTKVCIFSESDFLEVLKVHPQLMLRFIEKITSKIEGYESRLKQRGDSAEDLIMNELRRLQKSRRRSLFGIFKASNVHLTHEELAELTGLNRVTVTRSLKRLKEADRIKIGSSGIELM